MKPISSGSTLGPLGGRGGGELRNSKVPMKTIVKEDLLIRYLSNGSNPSKSHKNEFIAMF